MAIKNPIRLVVDDKASELDSIHWVWRIRRRRCRRFHTYRCWYCSRENTSLVRNVARRHSSLSQKTEMHQPTCSTNLCHCLLTLGLPLRTWPGLISNRILYTRCYRFQFFSLFRWIKLHVVSCQHLGASITIVSYFIMLITEHMILLSYATSAKNCTKVKKYDWHTYKLLK